MCVCVRACVCVCVSVSVYCERVEGLSFHCHVFCGLHRGGFNEVLKRKLGRSEPI